MMEKLMEQLFESFNYLENVFLGEAKRQGIHCGKVFKFEDDVAVQFLKDKGRNIDEIKTSNDIILELFDNLDNIDVTKYYINHLASVVLDDCKIGAVTRDKVEEIYNSTL